VTARTKCSVAGHYGPALWVFSTSGFHRFLATKPERDLRSFAKPPEAPGASSSLFTPSSAQAASKPRLSLDDFARAVAKAEGAKPELNNPGDIKDSSGQIAQFGSMEEGERRLRGQLRAMVSGSSAYYKPDMTLAQAGLIYSGGDPNWSKNVAKELGVTEDTKLADLIS
jgi:hypothetical protein